MVSLGQLERAVMEVLWDREAPAAVRDVADALAAREPAYTTVMTVLDRLAKKGFVRRQRDGRAWRYEPENSREGYVAQLMLDALALTGDRDAAPTRFARSVSDPEAAVLSQALARARRSAPAAARPQQDPLPPVVVLVGLTLVSTPPSFRCGGFLRSVVVRLSMGAR
ncbi:BlaI/MecI/CopY family transcriptional regulator [Actinophytocola glycyrrhizae]|uniref:BlaI/MecI/CopY family transcriptional regulator n=1 Tax=Actinophytocola glycyrrhizae TaxID=2044873 RepID=A0ABV9SC68_9PSEU